MYDESFLQSQFLFDIKYKQNYFQTTICFWIILDIAGNSRKSKLLHLTVLHAWCTLVAPAVPLKQYSPRVKYKLSAINSNLYHTCCPTIIVTRPSALGMSDPIKDQLTVVPFELITINNTRLKVNIPDLRSTYQKYGQHTRN